MMIMKRSGKLYKMNQWICKYLPSGSDGYRSGDVCTIWRATLWNMIVPPLVSIIVTVVIAAFVVVGTTILGAAILNLTGLISVSSLSEMEPLWWIYTTLTGLGFWGIVGGLSFLKHKYDQRPCKDKVEKQPAFIVQAYKDFKHKHCTLVKWED